MLLESWLAYAHFIAIFAVIVFITSEAALCRIEWMNAAVIRRLGRLDLIYLVAALAVVLTGLARTYWGVKGGGWYWQQPLLHIKVTLFAIIGLISIKPTLSFIRWRKQLDASGALPGEAEVKSVRRLIMIQAHLMIFIPLAATFLARGIWVKA